MPPNRSAVAAHIARTSSSSATFDAERERRRRRAERDRLLGEPEVDVGDADLRTLAGEHDRGLAAHPAAGARDHADLAVEPSHDQPSVEMNTLLTSE